MPGPQSGISPWGALLSQGAGGLGDLYQQQQAIQLAEKNRALEAALRHDEIQQQFENQKALQAQAQTSAQQLRQGENEQQMLITMIQNLAPGTEVTPDFASLVRTHPLGKILSPMFKDEPATPGVAAPAGPPPLDASMAGAPVPRGPAVAPTPGKTIFTGAQPASVRNAETSAATQRYKADLQATAQAEKTRAMTALNNAKDMMLKAQAGYFGAHSQAVLTQARAAATAAEAAVMRAQNQMALGVMGENNDVYLGELNAWLKGAGLDSNDTSTMLPFLMGGGSAEALKDILSRPKPANPLGATPPQRPTGGGAPAAMPGLPPGLAEEILKALTAGKGGG